MRCLYKIIFLFFFLYKANLAYSNSELPFNNITINEQPKEIPNIIFETYGGKIINLKSQNSKIYVLNFWATWCLPCKEEMPHLDKLQKLKGVKVFPINIEKKNKLKTETFYKNLKIKNLSIYFDNNNKLVNLFSLRGIPTTIILDGDTKEIARIIGVANFSSDKFMKWLSQYLK